MELTNSKVKLDRNRRKVIIHYSSYLKYHVQNSIVVTFINS